MTRYCMIRIIQLQLWVFPLLFDPKNKLLYVTLACVQL